MERSETRRLPPNTRRRLRGAVPHSPALCGADLPDAVNECLDLLVQLGNQGQSAHGIGLLQEGFANFLRQIRPLQHDGRAEILERRFVALVQSEALSFHGGHVPLMLCTEYMASDGGRAGRLRCFQRGERFFRGVQFCLYGAPQPEMRQRKYQPAR